MAKDTTPTQKPITVPGPGQAAVPAAVVARI